MAVAKMRKFGQQTEEETQQQSAPQIHIHLAPPARMQRLPIYDNGGKYDTGGNVIQDPQVSSPDTPAPVPNSPPPDKSAQQQQQPVEDSGPSTDPSSMPGQTAQPRMYPVQGLEGRPPIMDDGGKVSGITPMLKDQVLGYMSQYPEEYPKSTKSGDIDPIEQENYNRKRASEITGKSSHKAEESDSLSKEKEVVTDPSGSKMYDDGGKVKPQKEVHSGASMRSMYDDGGPIKNDPNDGHHQEAILEEGERVLTPEQNAQYEQEHPEVTQEEVFPSMRAPRQLMQPNPPVEGVEPSESAMGASVQPPTANANDAVYRGTFLPFNHDNAKPGMPGAPDTVRMFDQGGLVMGGGAAGRPKTEDEQILEEAHQPVGMENAVIDAEGQTLTDQPQELGMRPISTAPSITPKMKPPVQQPVQQAPPAPAAGGPQMQQPGTEAKPTEPNSMQVSATNKPLPSERENLESERAALKQKMTDAALGTNNNGKFDHIAYGEAKMALADLNKMHPWGTPGNHEGILGKIGHGLATAGELASDVVLGPGITERIPGTQENLRMQSAQGAQQIQQGLGQQTQQADIELKKAQAATAGMPKTSDEAAARAQFRMQHTAEGTPEHEQAKKDYDAAVGTAGDIAAAKDVKQKDLAHLISMHAEKAASFPEGSKERADEEQQVAYFQAQKQASDKLVERQREILAKAASMGITDAATNRVSFNRAQQEYDRSQTVLKGEAGLPVAERKMKYQQELNIEAARLNNINADATTRGVAADTLQQKYNAAFAKDMGVLDLTLSALQQSDTNQVAANTVPLLATLGIMADIGGVKRLNTQELAKFAPTNGSVYRWVVSNFDKLAAGQLPDDYQQNVAALVNSAIKEKTKEHSIDTDSVDSTIRQGAQQPKVETTKTGGTKVTPVPSKPQGTAAKPKTFADWKAQQKK